MSLPWFRLYAEFAHDPKVQMLSEADQRRYIMILCLRCCSDDVTLHERDEMLRGNGALLHGNEALLSGNNSTLHDEEVAFQLRISIDEWTQTKARLLAKKLITETNLPTAWERRQKASDSSAARVSAYRERQKNASKTSNVTSNITETKCNALEGDRDREGDREEKRAFPNEHCSPKKKSAMKTIVPKNFEPSDRCWQLIDAAGIDRTFARMQAGEFVWYWQDREEKRANWDLTFLARVKHEWQKARERNATQASGKPVGRNGSRPSVAEQNAESLAIVLKQLEENERVIEH